MAMQILCPFHRYNYPKKYKHSLYLNISLIYIVGLSLWIGLENPMIGDKQVGIGH